MEWTDFMHIDTDSQTLKTDQRFFLMDMVKNGCGQPGHRNLSLTVSQKWTDTNSGWLKVDLIIFGLVWSKMAMAF